MNVPFDPTSEAFIADPYPGLAALRAGGPLVWHEPTGMFLAARHEVANAVLRHRGLGRIWQDRPGLPAFNLIHRDAMLETEPPRHTRLRRLVSGALARGHAERLRPRVEALAGALAGRLRGEVDLVTAYAEPLPVAVIAELLGVPEADRPLLRPWSAAIVAMYEYGRDQRVRDAAEEAAGEFTDYLRALAARRRRQPGDDVVSSLVAARDADGSALTEDELVVTCILLLNAGHEASVNVIANGMLALLRHPDQLRLLRSRPDLVPGAVEELIRYDPPLHLFERTATADAEIAGVPVRAGQKVAALLGAANRDPAAFADPDALDVTRTDNPHLGFGAGIHFCVGAPLARMELQVSLGTLLRRFPRMELAGDAVRRPRFVIRGLSELPVRT